MLPKYSTTRSRPPELGFTLVEVMVGMVIAMLGMIIMMQMYATFEGQKRTTTGGDDAQNAGAIALYGIQQNIQQAGYCFSSTQPSLPAVGLLNPVMIDVAPLVAVRDANTNTILITYGNDACQPPSASAVAVAPASAPASAATMSVLAYAVRAGSLMQCDYLAKDCAVPVNWDQIAGDVVSLKAECNGNQAIRIALVTRNHQLEKTAVTPVAPGWSGVSAINVSLANTDATATALATNDGKAAWQYYRYKTFETVAPIRNSIWTGGQGC